MQSTDFGLCITADQNIRYQQTLAGRLISTPELSTNDLRRLQAAAGIEIAISIVKPAGYRRLEIP